MLVDVGNGVVHWAGLGTEEFKVVVLIGLKADGLKEPEEIGFAPSGFRLGTAGRSAALDETTGVDGKDAVCVTGGGDSDGVGTGSSLAKILPQTSSSSHPFEVPLTAVSCFTVTSFPCPTRLSKLTSPLTGLETPPDAGIADLSSRRWESLRN